MLTSIFGLFLGYTKVTEQILENKVAQTLAQDIVTIPIDSFLWRRNPRWPSKMCILNALQQTYPEVFSAQDEILSPLTCDAMEEIVAKASRGKAVALDGTKIFNHYRRMMVLHLDVGVPSGRTNQTSGMMKMLQISQDSRQRALTGYVCQTCSKGFTKDDHTIVEPPNVRALRLHTVGRFSA